MNGWGVLVWLMICAIGPLTFLTVAAHRVEDVVVGLDCLEKKERKKQKRRMEAELGQPHGDDEP